MEFRQIEHFLKLYEIQNMTKASQILFISQQGLSRSIKNLEDELNLTLFEKNQRGAVPTSQAETLHPYFEALSHNKTLLISQAEKLQETSENKNITIACGPCVQYTGFFAAFRAFMQACPDIDLRFMEIQEKDREEALVSGKCSFAILEDSKEDSAVIQSLFMQKELCSAIMSSSHPASQAKVFEWSMAKNSNLILPCPESKISRQCRHFLEQAGIVPLHLNMNENILNVIPEILENQSIGIFPSNILRFFDKSQFTVLPLETPMYSTTWLASVKNLPLTATEQQFSAYMDQVFPDQEAF